MRMSWFPLTLALGVVAAAPSAAGELRTLHSGQQSGIQKPERLVIRSQTDWEALWLRGAANREQAGPPPKVDWSKELVLAVFMGSRSTGGYAVKILEARETGGKLIVRVEERTPSRDAFVTQSITAPFHMVAAPKCTLPVVWKTVPSPAR